MYEYKVYGVGNALVDMEFEVSPELLAQLNIDKGVMTLVDEDRQTELVEKLHDLPCKQSCGGSAANTIIAISQFGGKCFYSCQAAQDDTGLFFLEDLLNCGVDTNLNFNNRPEGVTGKCLVFVTPDADRTMNTFLGITGDLSPEQIVPDALKASDYAYIEGYLVSSPSAKAAAIKAHEIAQESGVKTAFTLSDPNMVQFFKPGLLEIIGSGVDFLFANESEAMAMADTQDFNEAIAYLKKLSKGFAITRGGNGSVIFDGKDLLEIAPVKVDAVDTVGAGDMYAGAFLYGITHGMDWTKAGNLASVASAKIVTSYGPRLDEAVTKSLLDNI